MSSLSTGASQASVDRHNRSVAKKFRSNDDEIMGRWSNWVSSPNTDDDTALAASELLAEFVKAALRQFKTPEDVARMADAIRLGLSMSPDMTSLVTALRAIEPYDLSVIQTSTLPRLERGEFEVRHDGAIMRPSRGGGLPGGGPTIQGQVAPSQGATQQRPTPQGSQPAQQGGTQGQSAQPSQTQNPPTPPQSGQGSTPTQTPPQGGAPSQGATQQRPTPQGSQPAQQGGTQGQSAQPSQTQNLRSRIRGAFRSGGNNG